MKKRFALALVVASMVAVGCSSDDDGDDGTPATGGNEETPVTTPGTTTGSETVTDGVGEDAGPVEVAAAEATEYSSFYTLFDAIFGGETFDERRTPGEQWTIFMPTNAAFDAAGAGDTPEDQKQRLLQRHVVVGNRLSTADIAALSELVVNSNDSYPITGDAASVAIGGASVIGIIAENADTIVYGLDGFLEDTSGN